MSETRILEITVTPDGDGWTVSAKRMTPDSVWCANTERVRRVMIEMFNAYVNGTKYAEGDE